MGRELQEISGWHLSTLGELTGNYGLQTGPFGSQLHASDYTLEGVPVVMPKDMADFRISSDTIARIPQEIAKSLSRHKLQKGDIVFSRRGDIGRCALVTAVEEGWLCGTGSLRARLCQEMVLPEFVVQWLNLPQSVKWLEANAVGQTMLNLSTSILSELPVLLPPLVEQRKIAAILGTWDEAIVKAEQFVAALKARKRALMQRLLTGQARFPEFASESWAARTIGDFLQESRLPGTNGKVAKKLTVKLYGKGVIPKTELVPGSGETRYYKRKAGQFIYSKLDFLNGAFGIIPDHLDGYETTLDLPAFDVSSNANKQYLLEYVVREDFYKRQLGLARGGRKARRVPPDEFLRFTAPFPDIREQDHIANLIGIVDTEIETTEKLYEAYKQQKRALMQQLLTGEVRV
jgi:type I restriction enzyme, S subunit